MPKPQKKSASKRTLAQVVSVPQPVRPDLPAVQLRELRVRAGRSQRELAGLMARCPSHISATENGRDIRVSTLRRYITALGGQLEILVQIDGREMRLDGWPVSSRRW